jgi:23S rRNA (uracil1939-C5)-methyltransferase
MSTLELDAAAPVYGGMCLSRHEGVVFVKGTIPGERAVVEMRDKRRDYSIADAVEILKPSADRVEPRCSVYGRCGGCHYQHMAYDRQVGVKGEILLDCLKRIGKLDPPDVKIITGRQWGYRVKAQLKISAGGALGFYRENSREVVPFETCHILDEGLSGLIGRLSEAIRQASVTENPLAGVKEIHVLKGDNAVAYVTGRDFSRDLPRLFTDAGFDGVTMSGAATKGLEGTSGGISGLSNVSGEKASSVGDAYCCLRMGDLVYTVSPQGFLQSNWELNLVLIKAVMDALGDVEGKRVLDVYAGAGNFALPLAGSAAEVTAVEENPVSAGDGIRNAGINGFTNIKYVTAPFEKMKNGGYDAAVLDPPRRGLSNAAMEKLLAMPPGRVAYVSCNPSTFARDAAKLSAAYDMTEVGLVDMFPNTFHCESFGLFIRK